MKALVLRDLDLLGSESKMVKSILNAADKPDEYLSRFHGPKLTKKKSVSPSLKVAKSAG
jgi:hypothetical protein